MEYAIEAIKLGSTAIAVCTKEGIVLAAEKRITSPLLVRGSSGAEWWGLWQAEDVQGLGDSWAARVAADCLLDPLPILPILISILLQEPTSIQKVAEIDAHIGVAMSGLTADAKTLIDHGRVEAQQHAFTYNEPIPVESLTQVREPWCGCARRARVLAGLAWRAERRIHASKYPALWQSLCDLSLRFGEDEEDGNGGGGGMVRVTLESGFACRELLLLSMSPAASGGAEQTEPPLPSFMLPFP